MASWKTLHAASLLSSPHRWRGLANLALTPSSQMYPTQPPWLESLLSSQTPASKLYAWKPANIGVNIPSRNGDDLDRMIYILGVGNLGRLYASCLKQHPSNPPVTLVVHRRELLSEWFDSKGVEIIRSGVVHASKDFDIEWWTETPPDRGPAEEVAGGGTLRNLIVGTKASAAMPEVDRLRRYLGARSTVAFLQNGMCKLWPPYGKDYVSQRYPPGQEPNFIACVNNHGVYSQGAFKSVHASPADAAVGPVLGDAVSYLGKMMTGAPHLGARSVARGDLWVLQLQKLMANCIINPLTAILRCKNGKIFEDEDVLRAMDRLLTEVSAVFQALIRHESTAEILGDSREAREQLVVRFSHAELRRTLYRIGEVVKDNRSSMLQDVVAGKTTEIRDFNGWLIDTATFLGQEDMPAHRRLIQLVESRSVMSPSELAKCLLEA